MTKDCDMKKIKKKSEPILKQNLSSSTLFYFTDKLEWIIDSLKNGFLCRYHFERLPFFLPSGYIAPIKCFCDIPLSLIKRHLEWYGSYGIGIDKKIGIRSGVTPVLYIPDVNSPIKKSIFRSLRSDKLSTDPLLPYYKKYDGEAFNLRTGKMHKLRFYDEREWRYVPKGSKLYVHKNYDEKKVEEVLKTYNGKVNLLPRLKIDLDSLEYILVASPDDLEILLPALKKISTKNNITYENLVSKILTVRQIRRDF